MSCKTHEEIIDPHEGHYVCIKCGIVTNSLYFDLSSYQNSTSDVLPSNISDTDNFLEKFNLPKNENMSINSKSLKKMASNIYNNYNNNKTTVLLKELSNLTGIRQSKIKTHKFNLISFEQIVEKYYVYFNLSFHDASVLKQKCQLFENTGFQPLTIVAGLIYLQIIESGRKKVSMKKIASELRINSISIYRFLNYYKKQKCL